MGEREYGIRVVLDDNWKQGLARAYELLKLALLVAILIFSILSYLWSQALAVEVFQFLDAITIHEGALGEVIKQ